MFSLSPQKGEQKKPYKKGRENYEFSRQETSANNRAFLYFIIGTIISCNLD